MNKNLEVGSTISTSVVLLRLAIACLRLTHKQVDCLEKIIDGNYIAIILITTTPLCCNY